ncbi:MAG TPA: DUF2163 domain-containing protein [Rhizobiales bacterium]|nr:DUF2163 domain-containing protein [Hyphomicrobiales bacterium]
MLAHLAREVTTLCHCWRLVRRDGAVGGYTDHDRPLTVGDTLYEPRSGFSASEARDTLGLSVDTVDIEGVLSSSGIADADVAAGLYDGARVETLLVNWRAPEQHAIIRTATIGRTTRSDGRFVAELESPMHGLDRPAGRFVRRDCDAELGDHRCGFDVGRTGFSASGTVVSTEAPLVLVVDGLAGHDAGWFAGGVLTWTGGTNAGSAARVAEHRPGRGTVRLILRDPDRFAPEAGDAFTIAAGCDKRFSTCRAKFANAGNFRGFPHLPGNDAAYGYVAEGGQFDGEALVP